VFPLGSIGGWEIWAALVFLGVSSGLAHCVFTFAYGLAPVSALAPYEYTMLIWGGAAGLWCLGSCLLGARWLGRRSWRRPGCIICTGSG
jgi:drug/metabolite transporter (DMT)-like permease